MQPERGFILTGGWSDSSTGLVLSFHVATENGPVELVFTDQRPLFFIERDATLPSGLKFFERKNVALKTFTGRPVDALYFKKQSELFQARDVMAEKGVRTFESDVRPHERFLMERFINGSVEFLGNPESVGGIRRFINPQIKATEYRPKLSMVSFDIETSMRDDLYSIAIDFVSVDKSFKKIFMVGDPDIRGQLQLFGTEKEVYQAFENCIHELDPDLVIGWHVVGFDLKFLEKKCQRWGRELNLGRGRSPCQISEKKNGSHFARMDGRIVIDGPPALRGAFYNFSDFKLDTVANELLGEGKDISATSMEKVAEIERRFHEDKDALARYNLMDCELVTRIFQKTDLVDLYVTRSLISGLSIDRVGLSTGAFDHFFMPRLHRKGFIAPNIVDITREGHAAGGYVLNPEVGLHDNVIVLDFKSLYPSIIRTFGIDPYSRIKSDINTVKTPTGIAFSKSENILPEFIDELMQKRAIAKRNGDEHLSQAIKILMNSFYGVMGAGGSRFYHADLPTAITGTGQWILRKAIEYIQTLEYEVLYGDTDSVFVKLKEGEWTTPFDRGEKLAVKVNQHMTEVLGKEFQTESHLVIEFEKYYKQFFLPAARNGEGGAKKRYAGLLLGRDGREKLDFVGMEVVRSDWTDVAKEFQTEMFDKIFHEQDVEDWIREFVDKLKNGEFNQKLVYKKRLTKKIEEYTKNIPQHVRAANLLIEAGIPVDRNVRYVITRRGPIPVELDHEDIDYQHYIDKQIKPIADSLLLSLDISFDNIVVGNQLSLF